MVRAARESVAELIVCLPNELVWTSGATEANNLAIMGFAANQDKPGGIISQVTEHSSVLEPLRHLAKHGWDVGLLQVDQYGLVSLDQLCDSITASTKLVSIMWGNNEVGTVQSIAEIAKICSERGIALHCDAVQAVGKIPIDLSQLPITFLTLSAHKFYGPVGAGALFVRDLAKQRSVSPIMFGGGQEHGLRPGTLNVAAIVGLGSASRLAITNGSKWTTHCQKLRDDFESRLLQELTDISINGAIENRLPYVSNIAFYGTDNDGLLTMLPDIIASTGSACHFADFNPSHVLSALGKSPNVTECSLRFGFCKENTDDDVDRAVRMIVEAVNEFRMNA